MSTLLEDSLVIVLAGGAGERLYPLTKERAKPAVYFGGPYRIIDFALSNCINSGLRRVFIATQHTSLPPHRFAPHNRHNSRAAALLHRDEEQTAPAHPPHPDGVGHCLGGAGRVHRN